MAYSDDLDQSTRLPNSWTTINNNILPFIVIKNDISYFVGINDITKQVFYSNDGTIWQNAYLNGGNFTINNTSIQIVYFKGKFYIYEYNNEAICNVYTSEDGINWHTGEANIKFRNPGSKIYEYNNILFIAEYAGQGFNQSNVKMSYDGINWITLTQIDVFNNQYGWQALFTLNTNDYLYLLYSSTSRNIVKKNLTYETKYRLEIDNGNTIYVKDSNLLQDISIDDYIYIGVQVAFDETNTDIVIDEDTQIIITNQGNLL